MTALRVLLLVGLDYTKIDPMYLRVGCAECWRIRFIPLNKEPH